MAQKLESISSNFPKSALLDFTTPSLLEKQARGAETGKLEKECG